MTIKNFDVTAVLINGKEITNEGQPVSLSQAIVEALCSSPPDEANLPGVKKFERGQLAVKVKPGGDIDFTADELKLMKDVVGKTAITSVVFQVWNIIDGE